jgi:hypothetical protein
MQTLERKILANKGLETIWERNKYLEDVFSSGLTESSLSDLEYGIYKF